MLVRPVAQQAARLVQPVAQQAARLVRPVAQQAARLVRPVARLVRPAAQQAARLVRPAARLARSPALSNRSTNARFGSPRRAFLFSAGDGGADDRHREDAVLEVGVDRLLGEEEDILHLVAAAGESLPLRERPELDERREEELPRAPKQDLPARGRSPRSASTLPPPASGRGFRRRGAPRRSDRPRPGSPACRSRAGRPGTDRETPTRCRAAEQTEPAARPAPAAGRPPSRRRADRRRLRRPGSRPPDRPSDPRAGSTPGDQGARPERPGRGARPRPRSGRGPRR